LKLEAIAAQATTALKEVRNIIEASFHCKKPTDAKYLAPLQKVISDADKAVGRKDEPNFAHQKSFAEAIVSCSWVGAPNPKGTVEAQLESADFFLNQILTAAKNAASEEMKAHHRAYVKNLKTMLTNLAEFCGQNFKMGITWNVKGGDINSYKSGAPPAAPAGGPPVAPPPAVSSAPAAAAPAAGGMGGVFAAINKGALEKDGDSATKSFGLKKVTDDQKAKNRKNEAALAPKEKKDAAAPKAHTEQKKKGEPKIALDKGTWSIENYENNYELTIPDVQMKQAVYISNLTECRVVIPDKCKQITVDKCHKVYVQFKNVVSTFEIVNSSRCQAEVLESAPAVAIDKTHGFSLILSKAAYVNPPEIVTSNVSELNLVRPAAKDGDDPVETPLPEQYSTRIDNKTGKLTTQPVSHGG
jgi:adenylyl cyclase-associated protein